MLVAVHKLEYRVHLAVNRIFKYYASKQIGQALTLVYIHARLHI